MDQIKSPKKSLNAYFIAIVCYFLFILIAILVGLTNLYSNKIIDIYNIIFFIPHAILKYLFPWMFTPYDDSILNIIVVPVGDLVFLLIITFLIKKIKKHINF
jgi:hypothetical protein